MKKIFFAVAVVATLFACSDDELESQGNNENKSQQMTFVASMEDDATTRTTINSSKKVLWSTDDDLSILSVGSTTNSEFTLNSGTGTTKGTFTGSCPTSSTGYFAVYPYNSADSIVSYTSATDNKVRIRWNGSEQIAQDCYSTTQDQTQYETGFPMGTPMIAYTAAPEDQSSKTVSMQFKHVCAYFKVHIGMKVRSISISANTESDALTAQDIFVKWNGGTPEVTGNDENSNQVTLTAQGDDTALAPGDYYIAVLPGTITSGITLTLLSAEVDGEEGIYTKTSSASVTLERNKIYDLGSFYNPGWHTLAGSGTEASPYQIDDIYDLQTMYSLVNYNAEAGKYRTAYYQQTKDITCGANQWIPGIGSSKYQFRGTYNGGGYSIINPHYTDGGLFGRVSGGATIKNLTIVDPTWDTSCNRSFSGLVECVYQNYDNPNAIVNIEKCTVTGTKTLENTSSVTMNHYGGLVGQSCGNIIIDNCVNSLNMNITTTNNAGWIGGISGKIRRYQYEDNSMDAFSWSNVTAVVKNCRNTASITIFNSASKTTSTDDNVRFGGLVGELDGFLSTAYLNASIYNCVNDGALSASTSYRSLKTHIGGIVGRADLVDKSRSYIWNCINNGTITNTRPGDHQSNAGGILGWTYQTQGGTHSYVEILLCANTGKLSANYYGAIIGEGEVYSTMSMTYCYNSYVYKDANSPGCAYLAYPEGGESSGIKVNNGDNVKNCNVSMTNAEIVTTVNSNIQSLTTENTKWSILKTWESKADNSGLDIHDLRTK